MEERVRVYDTETFILRARQVHENRYDYNKTHYILSRIKVIITCCTHGDFEQTPNSHLNGSGCPKCGSESRVIKRTKTTEQFIKDASQVHGDRYSYDLVEYVNTHTKVTIICHDHDTYLQTPNNHLHGNGCPECAIEEQTKTTEEFIKDARQVHGDRYNYDKVDYSLTQIKTTITCRKHGDFEQAPNRHLQGSGCPKCGVEEQTKTTEQFIEEARQVHGDKYDYDLVVYTHSRIRIFIKCKVHNYVFSQMPYLHLSTDNPCPACRSSGLSYSIFEVLMDLGVEFDMEVNLDKLNPMRRYDYHIPEYKTVIEVHGGQHYAFSPLYHLTKEKFKRSQEVDREKKEFILNNGLNYIEISYTVDPRDLRKILKESLDYLSMVKDGGVSLTFRGKCIPEEVTNQRTTRR